MSRYRDAQLRPSSPDVTLGSHDALTLKSRSRYFNILTFVIPHLVLSFFKDFFPPSAPAAQNKGAQTISATCF